VAESFYHVYARGVSKHKIFLAEADYLYFLQLLERYLSSAEARNSAGVPYPNFYNKVELNAYCLMPNHFHLLVYQRQAGELTLFMRSLMTSYSRYFNTKYKRSGPLFESRFRASLISDDAYLEHISRYIHLNPRQWRNYDYSSLPYYLQRIEVSWVNPKRILNVFESPAEYLRFTEDYEDHKRMFDILKHELADNF
jgi:putative transposase